MHVLWWVLRGIVDRRFAAELWLRCPHQTSRISAERSQLEDGLSIKANGKSPILDSVSSEIFKVYARFWPPVNRILKHFLNLISKK